MPVTMLATVRVAAGISQGDLPGYVAQTAILLTAIVSGADRIGINFPSIVGGKVALASPGQDPAQSSPIILTGITDVTGLFSFLGIALSGLS